jgi:hypothetical protein
MAVEKIMGAGGDTPVETIQEVELSVEEIPIEPNVLQFEDGSALVGETEEELSVQPQDLPYDANLADYIDEAELAVISSDLVGNIDDDLSSRKEWEEGYTKGLDLLGVKYNEQTRPFKGASGVTHPLLSESATTFQASAYKELLPSDGPVRTQVLGIRTPATEQQADRVKEYMNYLLMEKMEDYTTDMDQMLYYLPLSGSTFKKIYFDEFLQRPVSKFVPAEDLVVPYYASDLKDAGRITHVIKMSENRTI